MCMWTSVPQWWTRHHGALELHFVNTLAEWWVTRARFSPSLCLHVHSRLRALSRVGECDGWVMRDGQNVHSAPRLFRREFGMPDDVFSCTFLFSLLHLDRKRKQLKKKEPDQKRNQERVWCLCLEFKLQESERLESCGLQAVFILWYMRVFLFLKRHSVGSMRTKMV